MNRASEYRKKRIENLKQRVQNLQQQVNQLKQKIAEVAREAKIKAIRQQAAVWWNNFILPYLEGVAERYNEPLEDGVARLIREKKNPLRYRRKEAEANMHRFFSLEYTRPLLHLIRPVLRWPPEQVRQAAEIMLDQVIRIERPGLYEAIVNTEGGKQWFLTIVTEMYNMLKEMA